MPAVTQMTPDLVGGVSTQPDVKKFPNQVVEAKNVMIDPSFGLCKRNGSQFLKTLGSEDDFKDAYWFFYRRDDDEFYLVAVQQNSVRVFNSRTLVEVPVTGKDNGSVDFSYLTSNNHQDYRSLTIQDNSIIVNRTTEVAMEAASTFTPNIVGTVAIRAVEYGSVYAITITHDGETKTSQIRTRNADDNSGTLTFLSAQEILSETQAGVDPPMSNLKAELESDWGAAINVVAFNTSLEIDFKGDEFTLEAFGGTSSEALIAYQDSVRDISLVADESTDGRVVKIENTTADDDDYYIKYNGNAKAWEETVQPGITTKLDASTMPHELVSIDPTRFEFREVEWVDRLVGDNKTNPLPSFVDTEVPKTINGLFLTNNRLGFLSGPNVILSVTSDYYNFFARSATTVIASDPIDINCNSTIPTDLTYALSIPTGICLFSDRQQFLMTADQKIYTPESTYIRKVSNYEVDKDIPAVDLGTYQAIINKQQFGTSRVYFMQINDVNEPPAVAEISKVVTGYLPRTIDNMQASPENDMLVFTDRSSRIVHMFRRFNTGSQDVMQAWFKWEMPGNIIALFVANDQVFTVMTQADKTVLTNSQIPQADLFGSIISQDFIAANVALDCWQVPDSVVYDADNKHTKMYVRFDHIPGRDVIACDLPTGGTPGNPEPGGGFYRHAVGNGTDATGNYYLFDGDLTSGVYHIGFSFEMEVEFPEFYYKSENTADYTAYLNVSRVKFSVGLTGALEFKLLTYGREEWEDIQPIVEADYYSANTGPVTDRYFFTVPIHQKNHNFKLKAYSNLPYPTCINMMSWEGMYSPQFYRRR